LQRCNFGAVSVPAHAFKRSAETVQAGNLSQPGCLQQIIAPVIECKYHNKHCNHHKHKLIGSLSRVSSPVTVQALQEAKARSDAASAEVQRIHKEVTRLEVAIPKLQLEAAAARQQTTDLQHRLAQLSSAAQVSSQSSLPTHVPDQCNLPQAMAAQHRLLQHKAASQACMQTAKQ